jgi:hypothetical protein
MLNLTYYRWRGGTRGGCTIAHWQYMPIFWLGRRLDTAENITPQS